MTPAQASYEARRASFWARHGAGPGDPLPWIEHWERLTDAQRADEEAGMLAGAAAWCEEHLPEAPAAEQAPAGGSVPRLEGDDLTYDRRYKRP